MKILRLISVFILLMASATTAQQMRTGLARVVPETTEASAGFWGTVDVTIGLTQGVPYRVFNVSNPNRLVVDFGFADWSGVPRDHFSGVAGISSARFGALDGTWSRLILELEKPLTLHQSGLETQEDGKALLRLSLKSVDQDAYDQRAGIPKDLGGERIAMTARAKPKQNLMDRDVVVVLDPGHGGLDPGAEAGALREADLMLVLAHELRESLLRAGNIRVEMTRSTDVFVSLEERVAFAHQVQGDIFISLHADALAEGVAHGTSVYVLAQEASDDASRKLAERHDREEILNGVDLSNADDVVAGVLLDLARVETGPRSENLAEHLVGGLKNSIGKLHKKPLRRAAFSVLKAADIPSVLIECGFISTPEDLAKLRDPIWRALFIEGVREGILSWIADDAGMAPLRRN